MLNATTCEAAVAEIHDLNPTDASNTQRFPENQAPSSLNNGGRALEGLIARYFFDQDTSVVATLSGSLITITANRNSLTLTGTTSNYVANFMQAFTMGANPNTGPVRVTIDGVGAIELRDNAGASLTSSALLAGMRAFIVKDDGNNYFRLLVPDARPAQIAANSIDGTHIALGSDAQGDIMFYDGTNWVRLAAGTDGYVLRTNGAGADPSWQQAIITVQEQRTASSAVATGTTTAPHDDTIPQNTEGDEYLTRSITPTDSGNKLIIEAELMLGGSNTGNGSVMTVALFQDSTANALAATSHSMPAGDEALMCRLTHEMTAGTTSATTFKIRAGLNLSGTTTFNGNAGGRIYGGVAASYLKVTETTP